MISKHWIVIPSQVSPRPLIHVIRIDNVLSALDPTSGPAPDLIVNVTGSVLNGPSVMAPPDPRPEIAPQDHPRKFHEMFLLRAAEQVEGMQPKVRSMTGGNKN